MESMIFSGGLFVLIMALLPSVAFFCLEAVCFRDRLIRASLTFIFVISIFLSQFLLSNGFLIPGIFLFSYIIFWITISYKCNSALPIGDFKSAYKITKKYSFLYAGYFSILLINILESLAIDVTDEERDKKLFDKYIVNSDEQTLAYLSVLIFYKPFVTNYFIAWFEAQIDQNKSCELKKYYPIYMRSLGINHKYEEMILFYKSIEQDFINTKSDVKICSTCLFYLFNFLGKINLSNIYFEKAFCNTSDMVKLSFIARVKFNAGETEEAYNDLQELEKKPNSKYIAYRVKHWFETSRIVSEIEFSPEIAQSLEEIEKRATLNSSSIAPFMNEKSLDSSLISDGNIKSEINIILKIILILIVIATLLYETALFLGIVPNYFNNI
ncbi:MAG: hypothetical protein WCK67_08370 [bacterium]